MCLEEITLKNDKGVAHFKTSNKYKISEVNRKGK